MHRERNAQPRAGLFLTVATLCAMALATYWQTLRLPFFWDDVMHFGWLELVTLAEIWQRPLDGQSYFRPLPLTVWEVAHTLLGRHDSPLYHVITLALHTASAILLARLIAILQGRQASLAGLAAGLLFVLFPFGFQAVVPVNSMAHVAHVAFVLIATLCAMHARGRFWLYVCSAASTFFAVMSHENGVLTPILIALVMTCDAIRRAGLVGRWPLHVVANVLPSGLGMALGLLLWQTVPRSGGGLPLGGLVLGSESQWQNVIYALQALAYPVTPLAIPAKALFQLGNDGLAILLVALPFMAVWLAWCWRTKTLLLATLGLAWFTVAVLPMSLLLSFSYVIEAPRLMYLSSIGAVIFLAAPFAAATLPSMKSLRGLIGAGLRGVLLAGICAWSFSYIAQRVQMYQQMGRAIAQLSPVQPDSQCVNRRDQIAINFPEWFFVQQPGYLVGHDGLKTVMERGDLDSLAFTNFGGKQRFQPVMLADIQSTGQPYKSLGKPHTTGSLYPVLHAAGPVMVWLWSDAGIRMQQAGCRTAPTASSALATFGGRIGLMQATAVWLNANTIEATFVWSMGRRDDADHTVFAQLLDAEGAVMVQADGYPLAGAAPMQHWAVDDTWVDKRQFYVAPAMPGTPTRILVGIYNRADGRRAPTIGPSGQFEDDAVSILLGPRR